MTLLSLIVCHSFDLRPAGLLLSPSGNVLRLSCDTNMYGHVDIDL